VKETTMSNKIDDGNEMKRRQWGGSAYSDDDVGALANRFGTVLVEAAPDPGLALCALMCVAASVIHRMEKCDECTDPDMVLKSAFRILTQQLEGQRRAEGH
jgi:hypothetical protein